MARQNESAIMLGWEYGERDDDGGSIVESGDGAW